MAFSELRAQPSAVRGLPLRLLHSELLSLVSLLNGGGNISEGVTDWAPLVLCGRALVPVVQQFLV